MVESFLKALKWYFLALSGIVGSSAFLIANRTGAVFPWIVFVLGFGLIYILSFFWTEFRGKILLVSTLVFLGLTFASSYTADVLYVFLDINLLDYSQYFMWGFTMLLGIPLMTLAFHYIEED